MFRSYLGVEKNIFPDDQKNDFFFWLSWYPNLIKFCKSIHFSMDSSFQKKKNIYFHYWLFFWPKINFWEKWDFDEIQKYFFSLNNFSCLVWVRGIRISAQKLNLRNKKGVTFWKISKKYHNFISPNIHSNNFECWYS